ncbi:mitochondrial processing peptidase beta subunit [Basidiobolus meristosporus CBS 931.73]|uniref:mitochondrial processing peptidase n=1 Tax=Basidiobolus meristosporus CBS 931.73 TaxID=1314790 RepID=A0A1Y1YRM5_9FUNG|nr:mitochondrial processing peptidase beta subunit [Basidiobolus meristosporus CBS 931.73]|eukprot:ORY00681.1 mitochondrial processing peptidase beta subunit [Basidiobolus meristosporus CBS 931.73]
MASRMLFSNSLKSKLSTGFRSQALRPSSALAQKFSSVASATETRTTTLPNGFSVATETNPQAETATVGVWIDSGSRYEGSNRGAAYFLEQMLFKGTESRSQGELEKTIEKIGGHVDAHTGREQSAFYAQTTKGGVALAVDVLGDMLQNSTLEEGAIERQRESVIRAQQQADANMTEVVFNNLHATAFQNHPLGQTVMGLSQDASSMSREKLANYHAENFKADRMTLVGAGAVNHEELVELAHKHFSALASAGPRAPEDFKPSFTGSEIRYRDDLAPAAHIALAVEGVGYDSEDYYTIRVLEHLFGAWDRSLGSAAYLSSRFSHIVNTNHLANSFTPFNLSYSDTGLFGIYAVTQNRDHIDDLVYFAQKELNRYSTTVSEGEVERAKQQLKAALLLNLDSTTSIANDIGTQIAIKGQRDEPKAIERLINQITLKDVKRVADERLWDKEIAVVGLGPIEALPDFNRVRGFMSSNRF